MVRRISILLISSILVIGLASTVLAGPVADRSHFTFQVKVNPYIEVAFGSSPAVYDWTANPILGPDFTGSTAAFDTGLVNVAYANTPVALVFTGDNDASDGTPVFARQETNNAGVGLGTYDRLDTTWNLSVYMNQYGSPATPTAAWTGHALAGRRTPGFSGATVVNDPHLTPGSGPIFYLASFSANSGKLETPHSGDIVVRMAPIVDGPNANQDGDWGDRVLASDTETSDWWMSADAGIYTCYMTISYTTY